MIAIAKRSLLGLLSLLICLVSLHAHAAYPDLSPSPAFDQRTDQDVALIIAVDDYVFLPSVPGARQNALDWESFFYDGLKIPEVLVLTDENASREDILEFARRASKAVGEHGTLWFVFIGHGAPTLAGDDGLLVGMDAKSTIHSLQARSVAQQELIDLFSDGAQAQTVMVIDASFNGQTADGTSLAPGTQPVIPVLNTVAPTRTVILSAASADQVASALPGAERPAFSYLLLGALQGWAANDDNIVTTGQAITYTQRQFRTVPGRAQTPQLIGADDLILTQNATERASHISQLLRNEGRTPAPTPEPELALPSSEPPEPQPEPTPKTSPEPTAKPPTPPLTSAEQGPEPKTGFFTPSSKRGRIMSWTGATVTLASGIALLVAYGIAADAEFTLENREDGGEYYVHDPDYKSQVDFFAKFTLAKRLRAISITTLSTGALALGLGLFEIGLASRRNKAAALSFSVHPLSGAQLTLSW